MSVKAFHSLWVDAEKEFIDLYSGRVSASFDAQLDALLACWFPNIKAVRVVPGERCMQVYTDPNIPNLIDWAPCWQSYTEVKELLFDYNNIFYFHHPFPANYVGKYV
jgi:hypothetical protein